MEAEASNLSQHPNCGGDNNELLTSRFRLIVAPGTRTLDNLTHLPELAAGPTPGPGVSLAIPASTVARSFAWPRRDRCRDLPNASWLPASDM